MKNIYGFVKAFVDTKNNMTTKDFLDNGYTMDDFLKYATNHNAIDYNHVIDTYKLAYKDNAKMMEILEKA